MTTVCAYDHDNKVGAMGFGAIEPGKEEASHCFPLKLGASHGEIEVDGVEGLDDRLRVAQYVRKLVGYTSEDTRFEIHA